jgi:lipopolysaccharide export LptBFGC system permease protein LptF
MSYLALGTAAVSLVSGAIGASKASKAQRKAEAEERKKKAEMNRLKNVYSNLDTSNPFLNMENVYEDLTINQQQAQFEAQQNQQNQANILGNLKGAAGGSGIASLAQTLAQQGQLNAQRSSASIGKQEAANQMTAARQAGMIQNKERQGEITSRNLKRDQTGTLLGMSQQETAAARDQAAMAEQAKWGAISSGVQGAVGSIGTGMESGMFDEW